jgi:hypothetical protein
VQDQQQEWPGDRQMFDMHDFFFSLTSFPLVQGCWFCTLTAVVEWLFSLSTIELHIVGHGFNPHMLLLFLSALGPGLQLLGLFLSTQLP